MSNVSIEQKTLISKRLTIHDKEAHTHIIAHYRIKHTNSKIALNEIQELIHKFAQIEENFNTLSNEQVVKEISLRAIDMINLIAYL